MMTTQSPLHSKDVREAAPIPDWMQAALYHRFGVADGWVFGNRVCARLGELLAQPSPFLDPRERAFAAAEILPLLALYQTLLADGETAEMAETEVRRLRAQALRERRVPGLWLAHAPGRQYWRRRLVQHEVEAAFPLPSFGLSAGQEADGSLTFEVKRCPYLMAVAAYGAPELLPTFCRLDEVRFDVLVSAITCERQPESDGNGCRFSFRLHPDTAALEDAKTHLEF